MANIYEKLMSIQQELNAPKDQHNSFGNYNYRSAESILQAVKPLCKEQKCALSISDEIIEVGGSLFIKATAELIDTESNERFSTSALAKHPDQKKGMDDSQVTGATSSYARKYALNGLLMIDDNKDADALPPDKAEEKSRPNKDTSKSKTTPQTGGESPKSAKLDELRNLVKQLNQKTGEPMAEIVKRLEVACGHALDDDMNAAAITFCKKLLREELNEHQG